MAGRRLQVFHTVARLLSFTKAAEALHMIQPAVTFQIRQLEEYFSTRLFDRTHNRISLTAAGERVFEYVDRIIAFGPPLERPFSVVYQRQKFRLRAMDGFTAFVHQHCEKQLSQAQG